MKYFLAGALAPFFWLFVLSVSLWLTRKLFPRAESWLFDPLPFTAGRAVRLLLNLFRRPTA